MKLKVGLAVLAVLIVAGVVVGVVLAKKSDKKPSAIPVGSSFAVAQAHSQGTLPACLTKNASAEAAVRKDDKVLVSGKFSESAFDMATTEGIDTIPAGTNVDEFIHSYDGKTVTGSIAYPPKYGSYNFTIVPSSKSKPYAQWTMTSLFACKKS
ncbi:MAG: hypothetical protein WDN27_00955 [Candidatus Saccharibacteria bacterium]